MHYFIKFRSTLHGSTKNTFICHLHEQQNIKRIMELCQVDSAPMD